MFSDSETSADMPRAARASFSVKESLNALYMISGTSGITRFRTRAASSPTSVTVEHDHDRMQAAKDAESRSQLILGHSKIQVTDEDIDHRIVLLAYGGEHAGRLHIETKQDERFPPASPWDLLSRQIARFGPLAGF